MKQHIIKFLLSLCISFSLSSICYAEVKIDINQARFEKINGETFKLNNLEAVGFGRYAVTFKWNKEKLRFDLATYDEEVESSNKDSVGSCTNYAAGTTYCDEGTYPTCEASRAEKTQIKMGMSYEDVANIVGCHGILGSRVTSPSGIASVVKYSWRGTGSSILVISILNGKVRSIA